MKWIKCSDKLPEYELDVIVYDRYGNINMMFYNKKYNEFSTDEYFMKLSEITHWMPLPNPPQEDNS